MRNNAGELLLVAGYQCNNNLVEAAELRGAWEAQWLARDYFPGRSPWLEGNALFSHLQAPGRIQYSRGFSIATCLARSMQHLSHAPRRQQVCRLGN